MKTPALFLISLLLAAPVVGQTQQPAPKGTAELVDRIVAIVGDSVIFDSEIQERLQVMEQQGQKVPREDSAALNKLKRDLIGEMVERLVLLQFAQRDTTIALNDAQINAQVDNVINQRRQQMGGDAQLQAALRQQRLNMQTWREMLTQEVRSQSLIQQFLGKLSRDRKPPPITDQAMKAEFERAKAAGRLPAREATIAFSHIVLPPRASDEARAVAKAKADSIFGLVRAGEDFVALAKRFTEEPGGQERGGDLGWARPENYVEEFANAVKIMGPGDVVGQVETMFGYHIIKLEKVRGAERQVRHILIMPQTADSDTTQLMARGREVAAKIKAGADVDSLAKAVGSTEKRTNVEIQRDRLPQVAAAYAQNLADVKKGDVVGPFLVQDPGTGRWSASVVRVDNLREAGEQTWDDPAVRAIFRSQVEQQRLVNELIEELKRRTHIEIRL